MAKFFIAIGMTFLNKVACYSQASTHILESHGPHPYESMPIIGVHAKKIESKGEMRLRMFACENDIPWPIIAIVCPNHLYAPSIIHIFIKKSSPFLTSFQPIINFRMNTNSPMVNQDLFTQLLKFSLRSCVMIYEHFC